MSATWSIWMECRTSHCTGWTRSREVDALFAARRGRRSPITEAKWSRASFRGHGRDLTAARISRATGMKTCVWRRRRASNSWQRPALRKGRRQHWIQPRRATRRRRRGARYAWNKLLRQTSQQPGDSRRGSLLAPIRRRRHQKALDARGARYRRSRRSRSTTSAELMVASP